MANRLFPILIGILLLQCAYTYGDYSRTTLTKQEEIDLLNAKIESLQSELKQIPTSCSVYSNSYAVQTIRIPNWRTTQLVCLPEGWTLIQNRFNGQVDFNVSWSFYRDGFGYLSDEFFVGLEAIHKITTSEPHELYIHLEDHDNKTAYIRYDNFAIGGEETGYVLKSLGVYTGIAGDSMSENVGQMFTTWDRDNDIWLGYNCAREMGGGWWYSNCGKSNLNGPYVEDFGLTWHTWSKFKSIKSTQMMIRRKSIIL